MSYAPEADPRATAAGSGGIGLPVLIWQHSPGCYPGIPRVAITRAIMIFCHINCTSAEGPSKERGRVYSVRGEEESQDEKREGRRRRLVPGRPSRGPGGLSEAVSERWRSRWSSRGCRGLRANPRAFLRWRTGEFGRETASGSRHRVAGPRSAGDSSTEHQERHDLARRLLSGDEGGRPAVPLGDVAAIMSHADVWITAGIYARAKQGEPGKRVGADRGRRRRMMNLSRLCWLETVDRAVTSSLQDVAPHRTEPTRRPSTSAASPACGRESSCRHLR